MQCRLEGVRRIVAKLPLVDRYLYNVGYVFFVHVPIEQSIEVHQAQFVALTLVESVSTTHSVLYGKELLAEFSSIDSDVPPSFPGIIIIIIELLGQDVDFDRTTQFVFFESLIGLEVGVEFLQRTQWNR